MKRIIYLPLVCILLLLNCKSTDVTQADDSINTNDANAVSKVLVMPNGTATSTGNPPAPSTDTKSPQVVVTQNNVSTQNGNTENLGFGYNNVSGGIKSVYAQIEGASSYYVIPVNNQNINGGGSISFPVGLPDALSGGSFSMAYCIVDYSGRVSNVIRTRYTVTRVAPLASGQGSVNVGGQGSQNATAVCDLNIPPYGKGYVIKINDTQFIAFYNMSTGTNTLQDAFKYISGGNQPFALYFDTSGNLYGSVNGTATVNGKKISSNGTFQNIISGKTITISASGNCQ